MEIYHHTGNPKSIISGRVESGERQSKRKGGESRTAEITIQTGKKSS
jgi:hypothetical protein